MTQISRPQAGHINTQTTSDVGPYSADQWADMFRILFTRDQAATEGPFIRFRNELEGTEAPANQINIDTGAGMVHGHFFDNNAAVAFVPGAPAANPRIDVVCMIQNNTAIVRTAGIATANTFIFPTVLTDYNLTASIEPFTCRLAILPGNEAGAPVAPTLDVDFTTLYMVPLYQYEIAVGGAVTANLDRRTFARFATDEAMVLIETIIGDNSVNNYSFSAIPQQFKHLRIVAQMKSNSAANDVLTQLTFNADVGANYDYENIIANAAVLTSQLVNGANNILLGRVSAFNLGATFASGMTIDIPNYSGALFDKQLKCSIAAPLAITADAWETYGVWQDVAPITAINIGHAGNFAVGTIMSLYGLR